MGPKLKEENERARARRGKGVGKKGRGVKDVVVAGEYMDVLGLEREVLGVGRGGGGGGGRERWLMMESE